MGTLQCVSDWSHGVRKVGNMSPCADGCLWAVNYLAMGWHPSVQRHLRRLRLRKPLAHLPAGGPGGWLRTLEECTTDTSAISIY